MEKQLELMLKTEDIHPSIQLWTQTAEVLKAEVSKQIYAFIFSFLLLRFGCDCVFLGANSSKANNVSAELTDSIWILLLFFFSW